MRSGIRTLKGVFLGAVTAITSSAIVLGSFVLAFTEGGRGLALAPSPTIQVTSLPTILLPTLLPPTKTPTATPTIPPSSTPTATPLSQATEATPAAATCPPPPSDWMPITVERGDTLRRLADAYGTTQDELIEVNCLVVSRLQPGETLYVPGFIPLPPPVECGPPPGWVIYIVQRGDTLFTLSKRFGVSVSQLMQANCLTSDNIRAGQQLYVPYQPSPLPTPTHRPTETRPPSPTDTPPPIPTPTPTEDNIYNSTPPPPSAPALPFAPGTTPAP
jgi:LysM repeat protein